MCDIAGPVISKPRHIALCVHRRCQQTVITIYVARDAGVLGDGSDNRGAAVGMTVGQVMCNRMGEAPGPVITVFADIAGGIDSKGVTPGVIVIVAALAAVFGGKRGTDVARRLQHPVQYPFLGVEQRAVGLGTG